MNLNNKKNILMICSWLDHKSGIGSFFIDQANQLSDNFNFTLINFKPIAIQFKNLKLFPRLFKIENFFYNDKITILYFYYPEIRMFKRFFLKSALEKYSLLILIKYFKRNTIKIDLIHAQSLFYASFWSYKLYKITKTPYLITEHNQFTLKNINKKNVKLLDIILKKSKKNLVVSNDLIRQFASNGFFYDFLNVGNSFDTNFFDFKSKSSTDYFNIITIGAYTPVKDQITLLKALKIIDSIDSKPINFKWLGYDSWGGDFEVEVKDLITSFNFKNIKIEVLKKASKDEIKIALQQSNLFVTTSLCETFGISALESLSVGTPVIATQSGGVNEFLNETNGLIIPIKDFEKLAELILKMLNNEIQFNSEQIAKEIVEKFGNEVFVKKMKTIYDSAI